MEMENFIKNFKKNIQQVEGDITEKMNILNI